MRTVSVNVQLDYLQRLTKVRKPVIAVAELIWNALDADATRVRVSFIANLLGGLSEIRVVDNGKGIPPALAAQSFENLGGSWKKSQARSKSGRMHHGRAGKGRFRAFSLGAAVEWKTVFGDNPDERVEYSVRGSLERLKEFVISDGKASESPPGTEVIIENIEGEKRSLRGQAAVQAVAEEFAIYLRQYKDVQIVYDGVIVDPTALEKNREEYLLGPIAIEELPTSGAQLLIIEWKMETDRAIFLCDEDGFTLDRAPVNVQAPGFQFSAYLRDPRIRDLERRGLLELGDLNPHIAPLLEAARAKIKEHFRGRLAALSSELVAEWKKQDVYPYRDAPKTKLDEAKRQVFDVVALNVHNYLPEFRASDLKNQKLSLYLLKQAIEENPASVQKILAGVLDLPIEKQDELAALLDRTSLAGIITASRLVTDRLDFIRGLEALIFDPTTKKLLLERRQLHRILEGHTWLFGEEFNLTVSDQSLSEVLLKHLEKLGRTADNVDPVKREDGTDGIVDLMLSRSIPQNRPEEQEHLVVELKRPSKKIDGGVIAQIQSYAVAVARDERFRDTTTRWIFWAISNEVTDEARFMAQQSNRPSGLIVDNDNPRFQVWIKSWGQLIADAKARLKVMQKALEYEATEESALAYLRQLHADHLPGFVRSKAEKSNLKLERTEPITKSRKPA
jgi:histidine kinase/DNA gyrase B/HSP90-like ATPase